MKYIFNTILKFNIKLLFIKNKRIPYKILPAEFNIIDISNSLSIKCLKENFDNIMNTLKSISQESEISAQLEASIQPYIDNVANLPGKDNLYSFVKSKNYYFGPTFTIEGSLSITNKFICMKVPSFISEELQQDLNQYNSSLS